MANFDFKYVQRQRAIEDRLRDTFIDLIPRKVDQLTNIEGLDLTDTDFDKLQRLDRALNEAIFAYTAVLLDKETRFKTLDPD